MHQLLLKYPFYLILGDFYLYNTEPYVTDCFIHMAFN